jgi:hypothetical protein
MVAGAGKETSEYGATCLFPNSACLLARFERSWPASTATRPRSVASGHMSAPTGANARSSARPSKIRAASACARSLSLAKLHQSTGRPAEAHAVLAPALEGFSPTPEMPQVADAEALLALHNDGLIVAVGLSPSS